MMGYTPDEKLRAGLGGQGSPNSPDQTADGRLPTRGRHYDRIHMGPSPDYQGEFLLYLDSPENGSLRIGLDVADLAELRSALPGRQGATADEVRERLQDLIRHWDPDPDRTLTSMEERAIEALRLVISMLGTVPPAPRPPVTAGEVREFLAARLGAPAGDGTAQSRHWQDRALRTVIETLEGEA
jgi:hypothetical protein